MPYPSVGCQTCKLRRVKCDEAKPICQRCTKAKRICIDSSIVKQASFAIHVENSFASGRAKRPRGPRSNITTLSPHFDLQARAVAYYLQYHSQALQDVPNLTRGLSECITIWKASGKSCPMVDLAIASLALVVFSRTQQHPPALTEASSNYSRLLGVAQHRIAQLSFPTLDEPNIESCLLAASLMSRYEGATISADKAYPTSIFTSDPRWSHCDGAKAILKVWRDNFTQNAPNFIIKQTRRELLRTSLVRNLPLPDWMQDGSLFGEQDLELEYDRIMVRVVNLHYAVMMLQRQNSQLLSEAENLNNEAQKLDKLLQAWSTNIPGACVYKRHDISDLNPCPQRHFYSQAVYSFPKPGFASAWCQYFAVCLVINSVRYKIIELYRLDPTIGLCHKQLQDECTARLESMADNLACSIPFCLERIKVDNSSANQPSAILNPDEEIKPYLARLISWPLLVASTVEGISAIRQRWFRQELSCLGRVTGDGLFECGELMKEQHSNGSH